MLHSPSIHQIAIIVALTTAAGLLLHDTKLDQAASTALAVPIVAIGFELGTNASRLGNEGHTHIESVSVAQAIRDLHAGTPRVQPRDDHKKYHIQNKVLKGHSFGGIYIPETDLA